MKRLLPIVFLALTLVLIWIWAYGMPEPLHGSVISPVGPAPQLALRTTAGEAFLLDQLFGRPVLLFFGYTHCPDVCPATLADMKIVFQQLGERADEAAFVFVTVDPARDTPERLAAFLAEFNPEFIGLHGTVVELQAVYEAYNINVRLLPAAGSAGYEVEHVSRLFVIDKNGYLVETFPTGTGRDMILQDLQQLISD